jgi:hypothetical protein
VKLRFPDIATKWLLLVVLVELALVSVLGYLLVVPASGPRLTIENFKLIEYGMSRDEVVAILGEPFPDQSFASDGPRGSPPPNYVRVLWKTNDTQIGVIFDPSGRVGWADLWVDAERPPDDTPLDRIKKLWKRLFP